MQLFEGYLDYLNNRGDVIFTKLDRSYSVQGQNPVNPTTSYTPTANTIMHNSEEELYNKISENTTTTKLIEH